MNWKVSNIKVLSFKINTSGILAKEIEFFFLIRIKNGQVFQFSTENLNLALDLISLRKNTYALAAFVYKNSNVISKLFLVSLSRYNTKTEQEIFVDICKLGLEDYKIIFMDDFLILFKPGGKICKNEFLVDFIDSQLKKLKENFYFVHDSNLFDMKDFAELINSGSEIFETPADFFDIN